MLPSPLVYVGPTLSAQEVSRALPGCLLRPPIARGDLYRDRLLRGSVFVILDGVFFQQRAVSPREIFDVIEDGGLVVGASSLGALRAAECWPVGMRGIGSIYRLLRAGGLASDDEVAVAFDAADPARRSSIPLVNVRYAVWRAVRERHMEGAIAARVVASAQALFYSDRRWATILAGAGIREPDGPMARALAGYDLKRIDALRALGRVQRWSARDPEFCFRPRRSTSPFIRWQAEREYEYDALDGKPALAALRELSRWLVASGRYLRYPGALGGKNGAPVRQRKRATEHELDRWFKRRRLFGPEGRTAWIERTGLSPSALARAAMSRAEGRAFLSEFFLDEELATERLAAAVALSGELDAELFRCRAVHHLAADATALGLTPSELDRHLATERMVVEHDCDSWTELLQLGFDNPLAHELFHFHRELLARAHAAQKRC